MIVQGQINHTVQFYEHMLQLIVLDMGQTLRWGYRHASRPFEVVTTKSFSPMGKSKNCDSVRIEKAYAIGFLYGLINAYFFMC